MREKPDVGAGAEAGKAGKKKRLDLNVPQVAGSALAAVVAAKLASYFGVYGTILGAGVVSIVATCGGSVFQHLFRRTGEQIRDATVYTRPREEQKPAAPGEFTEGTVYRARVKSWKRPVVAAAVVFGVTMAGITTYELVSGSSFSGGSSTTVGDVLTGRDKSSSTPDTSPSPSWTPSHGAGTPSEGAATGSTPSGSGETGATPGTAGTDATKSPAPGTTVGPDTGSADTPTSTPTPSVSATPPAPDAGSRFQTADPGPSGPSGQ